MKRIILIIGSILTGIVFFICCQSPANDKKSGDGSDTAVEGTAASYSFGISFNPTPPKELVANATPEQKASFAWNEFLALNWKSSYASNGKRDMPDTTWSYEGDTARYPPLAVWETYGHRTELRPYSDNMEPFDNPPHYSFGGRVSAFPGSNAQFNLFDNLDENNEIGSCDVYGQVDSYGKNYAVLFQAKANRDEYDYLLANYKTKALLLAATTNTANNITTDSAYYPGAGVPCNCPKDKNVLCLPCGGAPIPGGNGRTYTGAMEVKTAWRPLTPKDDPSRFFTRTVISYQKDPGGSGRVYYTNTTYALIGLHIIHKTQNYPNFIFATFEQVDVEKDDMGYVDLDNNGKETGPLHANFPRLHPIPAIADSSTAYVHRDLLKKNPNSIWQYYRLVGVQGNPTNDENSFSFFLANYVIESDSTLGNFRGSSIATPFNGKANTLYMGHGISMGGCQGCHGVAQTKLGGDNSFLMDTIGKPVYLPDIANPSSKLQKYIRTLQQLDLVHKALPAPGR